MGRVEGRHYPRAEAVDAPLVTYVINVTNTGKVDSDDAVLGFLTPPGAGTNGTALQTLFNFKRVFVKAGQTVTVYGVHFGVKETLAHGMGYAETRLATF